MVDANAEVRKILNKLHNVTVTYQYPKSFKKLPAVSYYTLTEQGSAAYDNRAVMQDSTIQIDIWADMPKQCTDISMNIYTLLAADDWCQEMVMDVPNPDGDVYHRTMRFVKTFII